MNQINKAFIDKKFEEVVSYCDLILKEDSLNLNVLLKKSDALAELGQIQESIDCLKLIIETDDKIIPAWINLGYRYLDFESYNDAIDCFDYVLKLNPNSLPAITGKSMACIKIGDLKTAKLYLDKINR